MLKLRSFFVCAVSQSGRKDAPMSSFFLSEQIGSDAKALCCRPLKSKSAYFKITTKLLVTSWAGVTWCLEKNILQEKGSQAVVGRPHISCFQSSAKFSGWYAHFIAFKIVLYSIQNLVEGRREFMIAGFILKLEGATVLPFGMGQTSGDSEDSGLALKETTRNHCLKCHVSEPWKS